VVEAKIGDANTANPMHAAFEQLLRYRNGRAETLAAGLREGEPRLFHTNLLLICTCGEKATYGSVTSGYEHFYAWKDIWPESNRAYRYTFFVAYAMPYHAAGFTFSPVGKALQIPRLPNWSRFRLVCVRWCWRVSGALRGGAAPQVGIADALACVAKIFGNRQPGGCVTLGADRRTGA
jgi:hypothetical protein